MMSTPTVPRPSRGPVARGLAALLFPLLLIAGCAAPPAPPAPAAIDTAAAERPLETTGGLVVSANEIASRIGADVLGSGGNAVDAAVATGLALAVVFPSAGNIGGGGFMVIRFPDGTATTFDFREKAPLAAHPEVFVDESGTYSRDVQARSHMAVGVPGTVAGFALAHARYGQAEWETLVEPAVRLAADGFVLSGSLAGSLENQVSGSMSRYPASVAAFSDEGVPYAPGEVLRQPDLAATLGRVRDEGRDGFYLGETAELIVDEMEANGGMITAEDLEIYEAQERPPITGTFRGWEIISMPPPSSGGVALVEMLNILEGFDLASMGQASAPYFHHVAEAQRLAYRDRAMHVADTDFWPVPIDRLTSKEYAAELRAGIDPERAGASSPEDVMLPAESPETTHFSIVDREGLAVSVTYTLEASYGSKIVVPGGGFLLNNEMGDFNGWPGTTTESGRIGTEPNLTRPEQRMLSSMTPTILARDGELAAVIGTPGGRTIINTVLHLTLNLAEFGMGLEDALAATRSHHQWLPDRIVIEALLSERSVVAELEGMGHDVQVRGDQGQAHAIAVDPETGIRLGVPDPRSSDAGAAATD